MALRALSGSRRGHCRQNPGLAKQIFSSPARKTAENKNKVAILVQDNKNKYLQEHDYIIGID